jgi:D-alanyl-D-alanine carboxypeptidase
MGGVNHHHRSSSRAAARAIGAVLSIAALVAACGGADPTPQIITVTKAPATAAASVDPGQTTDPIATPEATAGATAAPSDAPAAIYPVPTSQLAPAPAAPVTHLDKQAAANLLATLNALRVKGHFPGMSAAVIFPDGAMWTGQSGLGVLGGAKVTATTLFNIGSISKTFTGALALRLISRGTLSLDDHVSKWYPAYTNASRITIRMLMNHTSGIRDLFEIKSIDAAPNVKWTPEGVMAAIGRPYFAPGTNYHYSSTNFVLLGMIIEKATGKKLAAMIRTEFLTPLGLSHTYFQTEEKAKGTFAHGYMAPYTAPVDVSVGQSMIPFLSEATAAGASGAFVSTPTDIAKWVSALYDGSLFDDATMASLTDVSLTAPYKPHLLYGLAFEQLPIAGRIAWGHRGHMNGFWSTMAYLPDYHLTVVVMMNADWPNPLPQITALVNVLVK